MKKDRGSQLKKFIYISGLAGIGFLATNCSTGYVASEPVYIESARPERPSNLHVWIDGDWVYSRHNHAYVKHNGYWQKSSQNRTYVAGHWESTPRGNYWAPGRWERSGNKAKRQYR